MGKHLSRLFAATKNSSSNSRYQQTSHNSNGEEVLNETKIKIKTITNSNKDMNKQFGLSEVNCFSQFENVLNIANVGSDSMCLFGQDDSSLILFDHDKERIVHTWQQAHEKDITKVFYCSKIDRFLSGSRDRCVKLWSRSSQSSLLDMCGHELVVTALAVNSNNTHLISGSRDNKLNLWDLNNGKLISTVNISRNLITDAYWSSDDKYLVQSSEDKEIRIWDAFNLKLVHSFPKKQYIQSSCQMSQDGYYAISSSNGFQGNGCEITIWDLRKHEMIGELKAHEQTVSSARLINSDKLIVSCSNDSTVRLWDFKTHDLIDTIYLSNGLTSVAEVASKRNLVVSSLSNGIYKLNI